MISGNVGPFLNPWRSSVGLIANTRRKNSPSMNSLKKHIALVLIAASFCLPQSYSLLKLIPLGAFFLVFSSDLVTWDKIRSFDRIVGFYLCVAVGGGIGAVIGTMNGGYSQGIVESLRLYVLWSGILAVIFVVIRNNGGLELIHQATVVSGIVIFIFNMLGVVNEYYGLNLISEELKAETNLYVGFMDGYIRINSNNISSLFFITPYLIALQFRKDRSGLNNITTKASLVMCLIVVVLSGRRALWICTAITPVIVGSLSVAVGGKDLLREGGRLFIMLYVSSAVVGAAAVAPYVGSELGQINAIKHLMKAFSSEDERSIQNRYLLEGFMAFPLLGSGFGAYAGYERSELRPWTYESVYYQMLFNFGIIGNLYWLSLLIAYLGMSLSALRRDRIGSVKAFCIITGYLSLLIGIYSNPMLRSFDYLITIGFLPLVASYKEGVSRGRKGHSNVFSGTRRTGMQHSYSK